MTSPTPDATMLCGFTVAVTDPRQHHITDHLRRHGATVVECPLLEPIPPQRDARLRTATRLCARAPLDYLIVTTAEGWRRWLGAADAWHLKPLLLDAMTGSGIVVAGPAVREAVRASGLRRTWSPSTDDLPDAVAWLRKRDLAQRRMAILSDEQPAPELLAVTRGRDAEVIDVRTQRWAPPARLVPLHRLVRMIIRRDIHAVVFGSAVAAVALVDAAERTGLRGALLGSLITDVVVAGAAAESVGPFLGRSVPALWVESRDAAELAAVLTAELVRRRRQFVARGIRFALQGNVLFIDGTAVRLDRGSATVLRALAAHPGATLSRSALARMSGQARAVGVNGSDVAVSRLRSALGEHCWLVATTFRYGYRLAVDDAAPELE